MNWRIVVAVIVAFVVGAAGGGFAERERVKRDRTDEAAPDTTTTVAAVTTTVATVDWFESQESSACPLLQRWAAAIGVLTYAAPLKTPWTTTRAEKLQQRSAILDLYRDLLPLANSAGKAELEFLIAHDTELNATLQRAPSAAAFAKSERALDSPRMEDALGKIALAATSC